MQFKNYYEHTTSNQNTLDKVFTNFQLPSNSFIHKGRCGIGGTWLALSDKRHTIITVPNRSIIESKLKEAHKYPYEIFAVQGGVSTDEIQEYLLTTLRTKGSYIKIMVIPDSFDKIIEAAKQVSKILYEFDVYRDCLLLLDECHTFITESYRGNILKPFKHFWDFKEKSVISATPYIFSDYRFGNFDYHKVNFTEPYIGQIDVVKCSSVKAGLQKVLESTDQFPGDVFIFLNSVTDSIEAIKRSGIKDAAMFFADNEDNHEKLSGFEYFYQDEPMPETFKKFNFFTCKYFEGWDLRSKNATMIFVTDVNSLHLKSRISIKGVQAVGRLRIDNKESEAHKIIHLTNINHTTNMKTQQQIETDFRHQALALINQYNKSREANAVIIPTMEALVKSFANIIEDRAVLDSFRFDQYVNDTLTNEEYGTIEQIGRLWEEAGYKPSYFKYDERLNPSKRDEKRKSKADKLKDLINDFESLEQEKEIMPFNLGYTELNNLIAKHPQEYSIYKTLGISLLEEVKYNARAIKIAMIKQSNISAEIKLKKLLPIHFKVNNKYSKKEIKSILQSLYNQVGLCDSNGQIKIATAEQLGDYGRFDIEYGKKEEDGQMKPAFKVRRQQFELMIAA